MLQMESANVILFNFFLGMLKKKNRGLKANLTDFKTEPRQLNHSPSVFKNIKFHTVLDN